jgi:hypothetical protein
MCGCVCCVTARKVQLLVEFVMEPEIEELNLKPSRFMNFQNSRKAIVLYVIKSSSLVSNQLSGLSRFFNLGFVTHYHN